MLYFKYFNSYFSSSPLNKIIWTLLKHNFSLCISRVPDLSFCLGVGCARWSIPRSSSSLASLVALGQKSTNIRIIFDKAFRQMKFKWLHMSHTAQKPQTPPDFRFGHFSWTPQNTPNLREEAHPILPSQSKSCSFPHYMYAASDYLRLAVCLLSSFCISFVCLIVCCFCRKILIIKGNDGGYLYGLSLR